VGGEDGVQSEQAPRSVLVGGSRDEGGMLLAAVSDMLSRCSVGRRADHIAFTLCR
jgi:hypothetical protein